MLKVFGARSIVDNRQPIALTLGNFDGVHLGHQKMIQEFLQFAGSTPTCVLTFFPHPTRIFAPHAPKPLILSLQQRVEKLLETGIQVAVVQDFSEQFANLSADSFVTDYLAESFNIKKVMIGHDFSYGKDRVGNFVHLQRMAAKQNWEVALGSTLKKNGVIVSSSRIRELVASGKVDEAEQLLGYPYALDGLVIHGDKRGRTIGFPTANLGFHNEVVPAFGVYACRVRRLVTGETFPAVLNCGFRPTLGEHLRLQIEAHIFDFSEDIYGEQVSFQLKKFIRSEMKFSGLAELKEQISQDILAAQRFFDSRQHSAGC